MEAQAADSQRIYAVSELTRELKNLLEFNFSSVCVRGEIGEYSPNSLSGHGYITIKDARSQLRVVFFRGAQRCQAMGLKVGSEIEVGGSVTVYEAGGNYQILAGWIRPVGMGSLRLQFEELQRRLRDEGLFDMQRKRPIPAFPKCVGVITSRDGAALRDFLNVLGRRHSGMHVRIIPVPVQGKDAAPRIANALNYVNINKLCDVIVLTRGGGSLEDLWPFNEEVLARAIYASEIPVISAVGHERDFTISDFVADFRCATPSVAAEQVVAAKVQLSEALVNLHRRLQGAMRFTLTERKGRYERAAERTCLTRPEEIINQRRQHLDVLSQRLAGTLPSRLNLAAQHVMNLRQRLGMTLPNIASAARQRLSVLSQRLGMQSGRVVERHRHGYDLLSSRLRLRSAEVTSEPRRRLERAETLLAALGPKNVLARGYSILLTDVGKAVRDVADVTGGEHLKAMLAKGELDLSVVAKGEA
ncbi:MAG: exodeoxyribonuclease VII large subunit [Victivallales bacterium]|nr:exodeoxyribonuclease VII large subunit [Victivallales bacterium]